METGFRIVKVVECPICHGYGQIRHPDGDIEMCTHCNRRGSFEIPATVDDVLRECGTPATQPVAPDGWGKQTEAAKALAEARNAYKNAGLNVPDAILASAAGALAVAEQLALLNDTLCKMDR